MVEEPIAQANGATGQVEGASAIEAEVAPVALRNVRYSIGGELILDDISFEVQRGEIFGVMGMSGSGKSTLLRLIMGLIRPEAGGVLIAGEDVASLSERELTRVRRRIGMCFQSAALFDSMSVAENVGFGLRRHTKMSKLEIADVVGDCLDRVGLTGLEDERPYELSGGMRKRVGIARAIAIQPEIMLYDEPSSGLDPVVASVIDGLIAHLADDLGVTSIVVSHHVRNLFNIADRTLMLYEHRVEQIASPDGFMEEGTPIARQFINGQPTGPIVM